MAYTHTDQAQFQARSIQLGEYQLAPMHRELMEWIGKQFGVRALDFCCEMRSTSKGRSQQLVHVILETVEEVKKVQGSRDDQPKIIERFLVYFKSEASQNTDPLKNTTLRFDITPVPEIIVTYRPLKGLDSKVQNDMYNNERGVVLKTFETVWTRSQSVIFYYTDAQVKESAANGTSAKISAALKEVDAKYGWESTSYAFDSKESFDRDYESKWHYYWK